MGSTDMSKLWTRSKSHDDRPLAGSWIINLIYRNVILRALIKLVLRLVTGKCEIFRIIDLHDGCERTLLIERSLKRSKNPTAQKLLDDPDIDIDKSVKDFMESKKLTSEIYCSYHRRFREVLIEIRGYEQLFAHVDEIRQEKYNSSNTKHEHMLQELWDRMQPNRPLTSRISKEWGQIGFQGDDPMTDFRGMGLLGLVNLVYFAREYPALARKTLQHSHHPKYGYSYAVVGINITAIAYELMDSGLLRTHFFASDRRLSGPPPQIDLFNELYCFLFSEFDDLWMRSEPENVMAFGEIRDKFVATIRHKLVTMTMITSSSPLVLDSRQQVDEDISDDK